jgi:hypothetical protein
MAVCHRQAQQAETRHLTDRRAICDVRDVCDVCAVKIMVMDDPGQPPTASASGAQRARLLPEDDSGRQWQGEARMIEMLLVRLLIGMALIQSVIMLALSLGFILSRVIEAISTRLTQHR